MVVHGYSHLSVGLLRRLASAGQFPSDIPITLMMAMRRVRTGTPMSSDVAAKLIRHATSLPNCVIDGFPASLEHLDLLPADTVYGVVWTPCMIRESRLNARSDSTKRIWTPGRHSEREQTLAALIARARGKGKTLFLPNRAQGEPAVRELAAIFAEKVKTGLR